MVSSVLQTRDSSPVTMQGADKLTGRRAPYLCTCIYMWRKKIDMYVYSTKCMQIITMWRLCQIPFCHVFRCSKCWTSIKGGLICPLYQNEPTEILLKWTQLQNMGQFWVRNILWLQYCIEKAIVLNFSVIKTVGLISTKPLTWARIPNQFMNRFTSSTSVSGCAHARIYPLITRTCDDQRLRSLCKIFERKTAARRTAARRNSAFEESLPTFE